MTPQEFCYWLQGHLEIGGGQVKALDESQVTMIRQHLEFVFEKKPVVKDYPLPEAIKKILRREPYVNPNPVAQWDGPADSLAERINRAEAHTRRYC